MLYMNRFFLTSHRVSTSELIVRVDFSKKNFVVRIADFNLRRKELRKQQAITSTIERIVVHPEYRKDRKYDNDIALVSVWSSIEFFGRLRLMLCFYRRLKDLKVALEL